MSDSDRSSRLSDSLSIDRRELLKLGGAATAGILATSLAPQAQAATSTGPANPVTAGAMPTRNLGRTGYKVGIFSLGGQAAVEKANNWDAATAIVERAIDLGVNYIDTAAAYGGPERWSQKYIGQVMKRRRKQVWLATKTNDRTRDGSLRLLEESLKLLQTDHLDTWQIHNLSRMEQVDQIFAKGGAMEALQQAREQKIVRHLGVTGHADPDVLMEALRRFNFDTLLLAVNPADKHQLPFAEKLLPMALERQMGIIGMKIPSRGRILTSWKPAEAPAGWEGAAPRPGTISYKDAMYYTLSLPVSTIIVGCDTVAQLEENIRFANEFNPMTQPQMAALEEKTREIARQALFFRRWS